MHFEWRIDARSYQVGEHPAVQGVWGRLPGGSLRALEARLKASGYKSYIESGDAPVSGTLAQYRDNMGFRC